MHKVPTHLRLLRGNPSKRPVRAEPEPPIPEKLPEPPSFLCQDGADEWWRVVPELHALGLLTVLDTMTLAAYCDACARWIAAERLLAVMAEKDQVTKGMMIKGSAGNPMANPLIKIARCAAGDMVRYAAEFGLTPRARSYLSAAGRLDGPSKFDGLLA